MVPSASSTSTAPAITLKSHEPDVRHDTRNAAPAPGSRWPARSPPRTRRRSNPQRFHVRPSPIWAPVIASPASSVRLTTSTSVFTSNRVRDPSPYVTSANPVTSVRTPSPTDTGVLAATLTRTPRTHPPVPLHTRSDGHRVTDWGARSFRPRRHRQRRRRAHPRPTGRDPMANAPTPAATQPLRINASAALVVRVSSRPAGRRWDEAGWWDVSRSRLAPTCFTLFTCSAISVPPRRLRISSTAAPRMQEAPDWRCVLHEPRRSPFAPARRRRSGRRPCRRRRTAGRRRRSIAVGKTTLATVPSRSLAVSGSSSGSAVRASTA